MTLHYFGALHTHIFTGIAEAKDFVILAFTVYGERLTSALFSPSSLRVNSIII